MKTTTTTNPEPSAPAPVPPGASWTRREFVTTLTRSTMGAAALTGAPALLAASKSKKSKDRRSPARKKFALIATEVRKHSHAQHFIDRFTEGYGWEGGHYWPPLDFAALYVDQSPHGDLTADRVKRHRLKLYPTVEEALTLGGSSLAVDGVVIIAEHGFYPRTELGQTRYPRSQFFQQTVKVFESSGRSAPVFNDKHLSTDWKECLAMVQASKRLGFPFLAGSSLPVTWRIPAVEVPIDTPMVESVCVCYGGLDSYDFHGLETAQCMSERRAGGETGIKSVQALRGDKVWKLLEEREDTRRLFFAALARSFSCQGPKWFAGRLPDLAWCKRQPRMPVVYLYEHLDGFRTSMFLLSGFLVDFVYAGLTREGKIHSCQMYLPMPTVVATTANFFNPLVHHIEGMILKKAAPYPVERTLLTSGMTLFAVESVSGGDVLLPTPEMKVPYRAPAESNFWRA